ncbi:hypothetical protein [Clostridium sp. UBA1652]|uniref:hypothetical protein n=1 Tax=Clostridium sp. UBA1652 TaxID=1946348 RepID=UPI00257BB2AA|nr:hypothetical protein [Clostridium sp. UBA1652]
MDIKDRVLIKYIDRKINNKPPSTYKELKEKLEEKYTKYNDENLIEEYNHLKYQKIAEESMNSENKPLGIVAVISVIVSLVAIFYESNKPILEKGTFVSILIIMLSYVLFINIRIDNKAKNLVYYSLAIEVMEKVLKNKNLLKES